MLTAGFSENIREITTGAVQAIKHMTPATIQAAPALFRALRELLAGRLAGPRTLTLTELLRSLLLMSHHFTHCQALASLAPT